MNNYTYRIISPKVSLGSVPPEETEILVELWNPIHMKPTLFNKIKVAIWNLVLPPHVRLNLPKIPKDRGE